MANDDFDNSLDESLDESLDTNELDGEGSDSSAVNDLPSNHLPNKGALVKEAINTAAIDDTAATSIPSNPEKPPTIVHENSDRDWAGHLDQKHPPQANAETSFDAQLDPEIAFEIDPDKIPLLHDIVFDTDTRTHRPNQLAPAEPDDRPPRPTDLFGGSTEPTDEVSQAISEMQKTRVRNQASLVVESLIEEFSTEIVRRLRDELTSILDDLDPEPTSTSLSIEASTEHSGSNSTDSAGNDSGNSSGSSSDNSSGINSVNNPNK